MGSRHRKTAAGRRRRTLSTLFLPLRPSSGGGNAGLEAIWHAVCTIPAGRVSTYGAVARAAGLPGRARLAGFALKNVPDEMNVPWHRVVGAGGRISLPAGSSGYREQVRRLRAEGVGVRQGRVDRAALTDLEEL